MLAARAAAAPRARRRRAHPAVRGGRRGARPRRPSTTSGSHPARRDRRHRRPATEFDRAFRPTRRACAPAGSGSPRPSAAASRSRRSRSTGSASCTSSATATTACRSRVARPRGHRRHVTEVRRASARRATCASPTSRSRATSACSASACRSTPTPGADRLTDPWDYGSLAEGVEAWGFRAMQGRGASSTREVAQAVVRRGVRAGRRDAERGRLVERGETETDAYMRIAARATGCCARTSGPTRCSSGCAGRAAAQAPHAHAASGAAQAPSLLSARPGRSGARMCAYSAARLPTASRAAPP